jgi:hypothetical protein
MKKLQEGALKADNTPYTAEEIKQNNEFIDLVETTAKEAISGMISKEEADKAIADAVKTATEPIQKELTELYEKTLKMGANIQKGKMNEGNAQVGYKSIKQAIKAALENSEELKSLKANGYKQDKQINVEIKAAVTMGLDTTIYTGATQQTITQNTGIISTIRQRAERYLAAVSVGQIGTDRALWVEETDEQGTPIFIGEGDTKTQISVKYVEKDAKVKKIAVRGRITQEMFDDLPQLVNYIYNNMMKRVQTKIEDQLLNGDNTGDNLNGVITVATAFAAGDSAETIVAPNEFDVMNAIATQVEIANGVPNAIFVHPRTIQAMKAIKATDGTPLWRLYVDMLGEMTVAGMRVISTTAVTAGDFVGGDMSVANVLFRESLNLRVGLDGTDWSENKKTALLESRLVQFVSANDVQVVVKGDFATAKTALQVVVTP